MCYDGPVRPTVLGILGGVLLGVALTLTLVAISGGWYEYAVLSAGQCERLQHGPYDLGSARIAPNQPNPCLIQYPRFALP
jgi:hypothetical protein